MIANVRRGLVRLSPLSVEICYSKIVENLNRKTLLRFLKQWHSRLSTEIPLELVFLRSGQEVCTLTHLCTHITGTGSSGNTLPVCRGWLASLTTASLSFTGELWTCFYLLKAGCMHCWLA